MFGRHRCPIAQLVPPGFPSPGTCFTHPVALLALPGEGIIRNLTWWLLGVAQCGSQGAGGAGLSIARQHKELSALLFLGKKKREEKGSSPSLGKESFGTSSREICPAQRCRITKYPELEVSHGGHN